MSDLRRLLAARSMHDFLPGDWVRRVGARGAGIVESINDGHAVVSWARDRRDILPFAALRPVKQRGSSLDRRRL